MNFRDIVGANTRRLRLQRGWTQRQLADLLGRHKQTVWAIENGRHAITDRLVDELAKVFRVDVGELVRRVEERVEDREGDLAPARVPHRAGAEAISEGTPSSSLTTRAPQPGAFREEGLVALSREELEELVQRAAREAVRETMRVYRFEQDPSRPKKRRP